MAQGTSMTAAEKENGNFILTLKEQTEVNDLQKLALKVCFYLATLMVATLFIGIFAMRPPGELVRITAEALIGACGSAVAALTSCLDRYANGFELLSGRKVPPPASKEEKKETFNRRMARWFVFRPVLGFVVAPVFIWGIENFVNDPAPFNSSRTKLGFSAFMGGLLAKSVIDLIKGLFKSIFKA